MATATVLATLATQEMVTASASATVVSVLKLYDDQPIYSLAEALGAV